MVEISRITNESHEAALTAVIYTLGLKNLTLDTNRRCSFSPVTITMVLKTELLKKDMKPWPDCFDILTFFRTQQLKKSEHWHVNAAVKEELLDRAGMLW